LYPEHYQIQIPASVITNHRNYTMATYQYFLVDVPIPFVAHVQINRPLKHNAFFEAMWLEMKVVFDTLSADPNIRAIVLSGAGAKAFTAGLDVVASQGNFGDSKSAADPARAAVAIRRHIAEFQDCISSIEKCEKRKFRNLFSLYKN